MKLPNFSFEKKIWKKGYRIVAGVDEVGRGALAGPVVAGAVTFAPQVLNLKFKGQNYNSKLKINDSKKLTVRQRERVCFWIKRNALSYGIGWAGVGQINKLGIKKASEIAFRKAIQTVKSKSKIDYLLVDAFFIPYVKGLRRKKQLAIINGDEKSISIAAASIIAKVYRDRLMTTLGQQSKYKRYKWNKNKGYGTKEHQAAIRKYGPTRLHRKQFILGLITQQ